MGDLVERKEIRNINILVGKPPRKRHIGRPSRKENIKTDATRETWH